MRFRTEVSKLESKYKINHNSKILSLGSCFADEIGEKLSTSLFDIKVNPFGIAYNNNSISRILDHCIDMKIFNADDLTFNENSEMYFHYDFHSIVTGTDSNKVVDEINKNISATNRYIKDVDLLIITMGTSYAYKHKGEIVANCHKMPAQYFEKILIPIDEQIDRLANTIESLFEINPKVNILLTVSPIRHIKEGLANNTLSKSMLRVVSEALVNRFNQLNYFPSYECMMDDLRDYRFYKSDLIHPNDMALTYIWEKFEKTFFNEKTLEINNAVERLNKLKAHKIMNMDKGVNLKHNEKISTLIERIKANYPALAQRL